MCDIILGGLCVNNSSIRLIVSENCLPINILVLPTPTQKVLLLINLKFDRLVGHPHDWGAFKFGASWCVCLSVNILVFRLYLKTIRLISLILTGW